MPKYGEKLIQRTQKGLSALAFETSKQSRILKRRMRIFALQKEVKADLQDLGSIVFNAIQRKSPGVLEEEEVRILAAKIAEATHEIDRLRDAISRISRVHKVVLIEEVEEAPSPAPAAEGGADAGKKKKKEKKKRPQKRKRVALRHLPKRLAPGKGGEGDKAVREGKAGKDAKEGKETK
jgi:hypothetical protein